MLKPRVEIKNQSGVLLAEFWDCLRLDPEPVRELRVAYEEHVRRGGTPGIAVDLSGVGFAGSAALSGFVTIKKLGARLVFFNVEPTVREVFRVSSLEPLFGFAMGRDEALFDAGARSNATSQSPGAGAGAESMAAPRKAPSPPLRRARTGGDGTSGASKRGGSGSSRP